MRKKTSSDAKAVLRRALLPAAALALMGFFGAYAVIGANGVLAYGDYHRQLGKKEQQLAALEARREVLRNRVALLDPRHANPDLVDELVRKELNVAHPNDVIVPIR